MRQSICAVALFIGALSACAADTARTNAPTFVTNTTVTAAVTNQLNITTLSGETYKRCKILRVEPDGLSILHSKGVTKLDFQDLPDGIRLNYRYDPIKANAYQRDIERRRAFARMSEEEQLAVIIEHGDRKLAALVEQLENSQAETEKLKEETKQVEKDIDRLNKEISVSIDAALERWGQD